MKTVNNTEPTKFADLSRNEREKLISAGRLSCEYYVEAKRVWRRCTVVRTLSGNDTFSPNVAYRIINSHCVQDNKSPKPRTKSHRVIFNGPATVVLWPDGTKTKVKCRDEDEFDPIYGYLLNFFMHTEKISNTQASKRLKRVEALYQEQKNKE